MLIRTEDTIDPRVARKKVDFEKGAHCFEVLKTSIISASNNEGQTSKRIPERGRAKKDTKVRGRTRKRKKDKYEFYKGERRGKHRKKEREREREREKD